MKYYNFENGTRQKVICPYCSEEVYISTFRKSKEKRLPSVSHLRVCKQFLRRKEQIRNDITEDMLKEWYYIQGLSANKIAKNLEQKYNVHLDAEFVINLLKKYNIQTRTIKEANKMPNRQEICQQTCLQKYGDTNCLGKNSPLYQKRNKTVKQKYGVDNVFQLKEVKEKIKQYNLEHYGVEQKLSSTFFREIIEQICLQKYGTKYPVLKGRMISLPHKLVADYLKSLNIEFQNEYYLKGESITVDIYLPKQNIVIQIYGDFWHANPLKYKQNDVLNMPKGKINLVKDIWEHDEKRIKKIENILHPNKILIFWQYDIHNNFNLIEQQIKKIL